MRSKMSVVLVLWLAGCAAPGGSRAKTDECEYAVNKPSYCYRQNRPAIGLPLNPQDQQRMPRHYDPTESRP